MSNNFLAPQVASIKRLNRIANNIAAFPQQFNALHQAVINIINSSKPNQGSIDELFNLILDSIADELCQIPQSQFNPQRRALISLSHKYSDIKKDVKRTIVFSNTFNL